MKAKILAGAALAALALMTREQDDGETVMRGQPPPARGERYAAFTGQSYDPATRTCEVTMATGYVVRRSWYSEQLQIDTEAVDLTRVALNQVRFLFNHRSDQPIGTVEIAEIRNGMVVGRVRFAETPEGDKYAGMVERGELTGVSVGYNVHQWTRISTDDASIDEWRATRWELLELSLVPVPADPQAGVRAAEPAATPPSHPLAGVVAGLSQEEDDMRRHLTVAVSAALAEHTRSAPAGQTPAVPVLVAAVTGAIEAHARANPAITHEPLTDGEVERAVREALAARAAETTASQQRDLVAAAVSAALAARGAAPAAPISGGEGGEQRQALETTTALTPAQVLELRAAGLRSGLAEAAIDELLAAPGQTRASASERILELAADTQRGAVAPIPAGGAARTGVEAAEQQRESMIEAIASRMAGSAPSERARQFMGYRLLDLFALRAGINSRDPNFIYDQLARAAMNTTSDFPLLLEAAANKNLLAAYNVMVPTYRAWMLKKAFNDFKAQKFLRIGDFPDLLPLGEGGEIKAGSWNEGRETASLQTLGRLVSMTRQMIVNDDLGAFGDFAAGAARAAIRVENAMAYDLLLSNPRLADGNPVFHDEHANLLPTAGIDSDSLSESRKAGRKQKNIDKKPLNVDLPIILCGADLETDAEKAITSVLATVTGDVNVFAGKRRVVTDAAIENEDWYNFADPATGEANFIYGYLGDKTAPEVRQDKPFNYDGVAFGVIHDFAVGVIDYRFGTKTPG
ncbi:HK97 family phage prohead protease [Caulobacter sp. CCNWLY153]|uniref:phage major capsid protein n=1 Tax=unclassified Caulobacter TaxID=2648921 RepID=UPI002FF41FDB